MVRGRVASGSMWAVIAAVACGAAAPGGEPAAGPTQAEQMAARGFVRFRGGWRTAQEIELLERTERASLAEKEWTARLERLRRQVNQPVQADRAAEEIRELADPAAVPALSVALSREPVPQVRLWYVEALARIRSSDAVAALVATAVDHPDPEARIAAVERLASIGPHVALPTLVAALGHADNQRVNRAAEAIGRLGDPAAIGPLIDALETRHTAVTGDGKPEGSTSATFTPSGGGLSMGGGAKRVVVPVRNDRVLDALVALTGANFEWDRQAWRAWLAAKRSPPPGYDPRRG